MIGEEGILIELELAGFSYLRGPVCKMTKLPFFGSLLFSASSEVTFFFLQEDGGKKIELKPGYLMEHDKDVCFYYFFLVNYKFS